MEQIKYTINLDHKALDAHPLGSAEFIDTLGKMANQLKMDGWLVENYQMKEMSTIICVFSKESINKNVEKQLKEALNNYKGFKGMIFNKLYNYLGDDYKRKATKNARKTLREHYITKITKECDAELLYFSRINGITVLKGEEVLQDVNNPITVNKPKM